jgi:phosphoethanolamine N-methyltransferase
VTHYPDNFVERLHLVWGLGFLSPGGPQEVAEIVRGLDLRDALVLDIGCGTGGPAIVLARDMGARLVCVEVEPQLIERARRLADDARMVDQVEFRLVEPGLLPFHSKTFDIVFSKDSLIHVEDKRAMYAEIFRVLKPGGVFAASDWLSGDAAAEDPDFIKFMEMAQLSFTMATAKEMVLLMQDVGFVNIDTIDRNGWYAQFSAQEVTQIEGPLRQQLIEVSDPEIYERWRLGRRQLAAATRSGGLRPTHLRGFKLDR